MWKCTLASSGSHIVTAHFLLFFFCACVCVSSSFSALMVHDVISARIFVHGPWFTQHRPWPDKRVGKWVKSNFRIKSHSSLRCPGSQIQSLSKVVWQQSMPNCNVSSQEAFSCSTIQADKNFAPEILPVKYNRLYLLIVEICSSFDSNLTPRLVVMMPLRDTGLGATNPHP